MGSETQEADNYKEEIKYRLLIPQSKILVAGSRFLSHPKGESNLINGAFELVAAANDFKGYKPLLSRGCHTNRNYERKFGTERLDNLCIYLPHF